MGIEPIEPGFKRFSIHPQPGDLKSAEVTLPTIMGSISARLEVKEGSWSLEIEVLWNTRAELYLPIRFREVSIDAAKAEPVRKDDSGIIPIQIFELAPGRHRVYMN